MPSNFFSNYNLVDSADLPLPHCTQKGPDMRSHTSCVSSNQEQNRNKMRRPGGDLLRSGHFSKPDERKRGGDQNRSIVGCSSYMRLSCLDRIWICGFLGVYVSERTGKGGRGVDCQSISRGQWTCSGVNVCQDIQTVIAGRLTFVSTVFVFERV
jgi:hypothetical protein